MFTAEELRKEPCPFGRALIHRRVLFIRDFLISGFSARQAVTFALGSFSRRSRAAWADAASSPKANGAVGLSQAGCRI
jgi:hypothetical protein